MMTNKGKNNSKIKKTRKPRKNSDDPNRIKSAEVKVADTETLPEASSNVFILPPDLLRQLGIQLNKSAETTNNDGTESLPAIIYDSNLDTFKEKNHQENAATCKENSKYKYYQSNPLVRKCEELNTQSSSNCKYENEYKFPSDKTSSIMETVTLMKSSLLLSPSFELIANDGQYKSPLAKSTNPSVNIDFSTTVSDNDWQPFYKQTASDPEIAIENINKLNSNLSNSSERFINEPISHTHHSVKVNKDDTDFNKLQLQNNKNDPSSSELTRSEITEEDEINNPLWCNTQCSNNTLPVMMNEMSSNVENDFNNVDSVKDLSLIKSNINGMAEIQSAEINCKLSHDGVLDSYSDNDSDSVNKNHYKLQNKKNNLIPESKVMENSVLTTNMNCSDHIGTNLDISRRKFKINVISDEIVRPGNSLEVVRQSNESLLQSVRCLNDNIVSIGVNPFSKININKKNKDNVISVSYETPLGDDSQYNCNNNVIPSTVNKSKNTCIKQSSVNFDPSPNSSILENFHLNGLPPEENFKNFSLIQNLKVIEKISVSTSHAISNVIRFVEPNERNTDKCVKNCLDVEMLSDKLLSVDDLRLQSITDGNCSMRNINSVENISDISLDRSINKLENIDSKDSSKNIVTDETAPGSEPKKSPSLTIKSVIKSPKTYANKKKMIKVENTFNKKNMLDRKIISNTKEHINLGNINLKLNETGMNQTPRVYTRKHALISPKKLIRTEGNVSLLEQYLKAANQKHSIKIDSAIMTPKQNIKSENANYDSQPAVINTHGVEKPGGINCEILKGELYYILTNSMTSKRPSVVRTLVGKHKEEPTKDNRFSVFIHDKTHTEFGKKNVDAPTAVPSKKELEYCSEKCIDDKAFSYSAGQSREVYKEIPKSADHPPMTAKQPIKLPTRCLDSSMGQPTENSTKPNFENNRKICEVKPITQSKESKSVSPKTNNFNVRRISSNSRNVQPKTYSRKRTVTHSKESSCLINSLHSVNKELTFGTKLGESQPEKVLTDQDYLKFNKSETIQKQSCTKCLPGQSPEINIDKGEIFVGNHESSETQDIVYTEILKICDMNNESNTSEEDIEIHIEVDDSSDVDASDNVYSAIQINQKTNCNQDDCTIRLNIDENSSYGENHPENILLDDQGIDELNTSNAPRTFSLYDIGDEVGTQTFDSTHADVKTKVSNTTDTDSQVSEIQELLVINSNEDKSVEIDIKDICQIETLDGKDEDEYEHSTLDNDDNVSRVENDSLVSNNKSLLEISRDALHMNTSGITKRKRGRPRKTEILLIEKTVSISDNNPLTKRKSLRPKKSLSIQELNESEFDKKADLYSTKKSKTNISLNTKSAKKKNLTASSDRIEDDLVTSSEDEKLSTVKAIKNKVGKRKRQISSSSEENSNNFKICRRSENPTEDKGEASLGKCAICLQEIENSNWLTHRQQHNDLAWREGEQAIDLTDSRQVYAILLEKQRRTGNKVHVCDKCGVKRLSIAGFMSHLSVCQKTEDEIDATREECSKCHNLYSPSCIKLHTSTCQGPKRKKFCNDVTSTETELAESELPKRKYKKKLDITFEEPPADQKEVKCAVCSDDVKSCLWEEHLTKKHYNLAWFEGGTPLDLTNECFMVATLNRALKANKVLLCYRCGEKRGSAVGLICHLTICNKTEKEIEELKLTCTVCERRVMPYSMRMHMSLHAARSVTDDTHAHIVDTPSTPALDDSATLSKSGRQMRKAAMNAEKIIQGLKVVDTPILTECNIKNMYTAPWNGKVHHIRLLHWQRDLTKSGTCRCALKGCSHKSSRLEDMIMHHNNCPNQQSLYLCKHCNHECEKEEDIKNHVQEHILDKAKDQTFVISKKFAEGLKKMYTPPWRGVTDTITVEEWKQELLINGISTCPNKGCDYVNASQDEILKHHQQDCQHHSLKYTCKLCDESTESEEEIKLHITVQHSYRDPSEESESDSNSSDHDSDDDFGEQSDTEKDSIQKQKIKEEPRKDVQPKMEMFRSKKALTSFTNCMGTYYKWMNELCDFHFSKSVLFPEFPCLPYDLVPPNEISGYLPPIKQSCNIAHSTINKRNDKSLHDSASFKTYKLFEGDPHLEDSTSFFVGGAVTALSWMPVPVVSSATEVPVQHLAVCTQRDADAGGLAAHMAHRHPALIQIWSLGRLDNSNPKFTEAACFELGIAHEYGTVWSLDWCPSGAHEGIEDTDGVSALRRMGLLAAACSNGSAYIFAVCHPKLLPSQPFPIYKTTPGVELRLVDPELSTVQATCVHWSMEKWHNIVVVGYSDGTVALFDLLSTSVLLRTRSVASHTVCLAPYFNTQLLNYHITALFIYPRKSSASDRSLGLLLGAASYVCAGVWARVGVGKPREVIARRQNISAMIVTPHWPSLLISVDDPMGKCCGMEFLCRAWTGSYAAVQQADEQRRIQSGGGEGCAVASSAWTGVSAIATNNGIVTLSAPQHPLLKQRPFKIHLTVCQLLKLSKKEDKKILLEVENYADIAQEYGIVVRDAPVWNQSQLSAECHRGRDLGSSPASHYPLASVTRLAFCPSVSAHAHLAQGLQCGLVHVTNMRAYDAWRYSSAKGRK